MPQISFGTWKNEVAGFADFALPAEYARFTHSTLVEGTRIMANPTVSAPYLTPGFFFTPKVGVHYAGYNLDRTAFGQPDRQNITVPWGSLDSGLVFERPTNLMGRDYTQTLEPRLYYVRAAYRNQDNVPLFDTALADFNYTQLFSENRFAGGDRFGDANQLTAAMSTRLLFPNGQEFLRATIGQRFSFGDQRVGLAPGPPARPAVPICSPRSVRALRSTGTSTRRSNMTPTCGRTIAQAPICAMRPNSRNSSTSATGSTATHSIRSTRSTFPASGR